MSLSAPSPVLAARLRYLRDCYAADNRRTTLWNVFGRRVDHRLVFEGREEWLTGTLDHLPVVPDAVEEMRKDAQLYQKEKGLQYGALFVVGALEEGEQQRMLCAPLVLAPAAFQAKDPYLFAVPDRAGSRANHLLLKTLSEAQGQVAGREPLVERAASLLDEAAIGFEQITDLAAVLAQLLPGIDTEALQAYPTLTSEALLRRAVREAREDPARPLRILPAAALVLRQHSIETRGVLHELAAMATAASFSGPVQSLYGEAPAGTEDRPGAAPPTHGRVPAVLSAAQDRVLNAAAQHLVTLVVGPPGTGKSYTIAAAAVEHLSRGESVLIASKKDHAVDVIADKIEGQLGLQGCIVRGGRKAYLKDLKRYLRQLLSGMHTADAVTPEALRLLRRRVAALEATADTAAARLQALSEQHRAWGRTLVGAPDGWWTSLRRRFVQWRVRRAASMRALSQQLQEALDGYVQATQQLIQAQYRAQVAQTLQEHRPALRHFSDAIRARTSGKQARLFEEIDFDVLLRAFPVWLVNTADVYEVLPLHTALFDVAIIDEATQCDMASVAPILQRARRVVVVGDPHQLRHVSFLAREQQRTLAETHGLGAAAAERFDYRATSILDLADAQVAAQEQVAFLDEHFRSVPSIIAFSNERFYGGALRVMTEKPRPATDGQGLYLESCSGRRTDGVNVAEAEALIDDVMALIRAERDVQPRLCHSIGILSPFRSQVDYVAEHLPDDAETLNAFSKHDLLVGTAHSFQGEERDAMFLSFAVDPESHAAAVRFLERPDVFNVSVTRARHVQRLYASVAPGDLPPDSLLRAYLRHAAVDGAETPAAPSADTSDAFARAVVQALEARGYATWPAYPIAGLTVDIVAGNGPRQCGIDLVGYPGAFEEAFPLERYKMLYRAGLPVVPLSYARWLQDEEGCLDAVAEEIGRARPAKHEPQQAAASPSSP